MWRALAVCTLLLLAGCGTPSDGGSTATDTVTPVEVPDDTTLAPGLTEAGVERPGTLADAHAAALDGTSYRLLANRTVSYANGTLRESLTLDLALAADRGYLVETATAGHAAPVFLGTPPANATFWSDGTTYLRRLSRDDTTTYNAFEPREGAGTWQYWARTVPFGGGTANPRDFVADTFAAAETRLAGQVDENGSTQYVVVANATTAPFDEEYVRPRNVSLRSTVTAEGLVQSLTLRYEATAGGETVTVRRTVRYRLGNTTAPRPAWAERV